jgi:hypothetical protein
MQMLSNKVDSFLEYLADMSSEEKKAEGGWTVADVKLYDLNSRILSICEELYDLDRVEGDGELSWPLTNEEKKSRHPSIVHGCIVPLSTGDDHFLVDYIRWLTLYSELSIFVLPFSMSCLDITYSSFGNDLEKSWPDLKSLIKYSKQYKHLLKAGRGVFLPSQNSYIITSYSDHRTDVYTAPLIQQPDEFIYTPINARRNILTGLSFQDLVVLKEIMLPYFRISNLDDLVKVAQNETESSAKFNHYLSKRLVDISRLDSAKKLQEILREIDYEVENLELEFERLSKLKILQGVEMAFFSISLSALLFANAELAKHIAGVTAPVGLLETFRHLTSGSEQVSPAKKSEFYLPYLLQKKSG